MIALLHAVLQLAITPALICRRPSHDARMVHVTLDHLHPFLIEALDILFAKLVRVRYLTPDEKPETIGPVHEDRIFDLYTGKPGL
jgi:hypothetical protein